MDTAEALEHALRYLWTSIGALAGTVNQHGKQRSNSKAHLFCAFEGERLECRTRTRLDVRASRVSKGKNHDKTSFGKVRRDAQRISS